MLPDYIFIGPTKTGTTWIDSYLRGRKEVVLPRDEKETVFFDKRFDRGLTWYESFFDHGDDGAVCVEVAPTLFAKPQAAARMAATLPKAGVICTLRNPINRAVSHYFHCVKFGMPLVSFDEMVRAHPDIISSGLYYANIVHWINLFGRDRVHVLLHDDMVADLNGYCAKICSILNIPFEAPDPELAAANANEASIPRSRMLARMARAGADGLRGINAGRLVNFVNMPLLKRILFGSAPTAEQRGEVFRQAMKRYDELAEGVDDLEQLLGINLGDWKRSAAHGVGPKKSAEAR